MDQSYREDRQAHASCDASLRAEGAKAMVTLVGRPLDETSQHPEGRETGYKMYYGYIKFISVHQSQWSHGVVLTKPIWSTLAISDKSWSNLVSLGHSW